MGSKDSVKLNAKWSTPNCERTESSFLSDDSQNNQELTEIVKIWWKIESYGTF